MTLAAKKRILLVCRKPPYGNTLAKDAIDIALATSIFEQDLTVAFIGDGVWQLHETQHSEVIKRKNHQKLLAVLPIYDINNVYIDADALQERDIQISQLSIEANPLTTKQLSSLFDNADIVLNF